MIQASELRIGNFIILHKPKEEPKLYDVMAHDIEEIEGCGDDCFPVPLTEDWLKRFGFKHFKIDGVSSLGDEETDGDTHWWELNVKTSEMCDSFCVNICKWGDGPFTFSNNMLRRRLKYVHQLQNLYFALTQKELILNSKPQLT